MFKTVEAVRRDALVKEVEKGSVGPLSTAPLYIRTERSVEELLVRNRYRRGDRIPPEADLVKSLGVSRVTVRAALARLVERGTLQRRRGSGTFVARPPVSGSGGLGGSPTMRLGSRETALGRLDSYSVWAEQKGLELDSKDLAIEPVAAGPREAVALEIPEGTPLVEVSRVLLGGGEPMAWMVDVVNEQTMPVDVVRQGLRKEGMLLDLLISEGVPVSFSDMMIDTIIIGPEDYVGNVLGLSSFSSALSLNETMYAEEEEGGEGSPVQWSQNIFLPGRLDLHVVRDLPDARI